MAETHAVSRIFLALYLPPFLTITALSMAACFAVAVWRYKMLVVTPRKEEPVALPRRFGLKAGRAYLFRERRPKLVFLALAEAVRHGSIGLLVTADLTSLQEPVTSMLERDFEPLELPVKSGQAVEDVFVIDAAGVLLTHASRTEVGETDPDVMAGMLTAIMNFARVSFAEGSDELRRLELGKKTVVIERSPRFILAVGVAWTQFLSPKSQPSGTPPTLTPPPVTQYGSYLVWFDATAGTFRRKNLATGVDEAADANAGPVVQGAVDGLNPTVGGEIWI